MSRDWKHARLRWTSLQVLRTIALDNNLRKRIIRKVRENKDWGVEEDIEPYFCYFDEFDESVDFILYPIPRRLRIPIISLFIFKWEDVTIEL